MALPTTEQLLAEEAQSMGRECELLDSTILHDGDETKVRVVLYSTTSQPIADLGTMRAVRCVVAGGEHGRTSQVVSTTWKRDDADSVKPSEEGLRPGEPGNDLASDMTTKEE